MAQAPQPEPGQELIIDAGCGTGASTLNLAQRHPQALVIGVDRSAERLRRSGWRSGWLQRDNAWLVRMRLEDFWFLADAQCWRPSTQYLLYPNPWPKPAQLMRRWHAHPVWPCIARIGGRLELRSNWRIYLEECAEVLRLEGRDPRLQPLEDAHRDPLTPFERKYQVSAHSLWQLLADPLD